MFFACEDILDLDIITYVANIYAGFPEKSKAIANRSMEFNDVFRAIEYRNQPIFHHLPFHAIADFVAMRASGQRISQFFRRH